MKHSNDTYSLTDVKLISCSLDINKQVEIREKLWKQGDRKSSKIREVAHIIANYTFAG